MLKGIPAIISPELLKTLSEMGHGDEVVICDANCPAIRLVPRVLRADVENAAKLVDAILTLLPLDTYEQSAFLMQKVPGDEAIDTTNWDEYKAAIAKVSDVTVEHIERFAFYDRMKTAYAAVITADTRPYGNIILKKGTF